MYCDYGMAYFVSYRTRLFENLRMLPCAPGVQMQAIPEDAINEQSDDEEKQNSDERISIRASDKRVQPDNEFSDSEDEGEGGRKDQRTHKKKKAKGDVEEVVMTEHKVDSESKIETMEEMSK
ncbi:hypothetical protein QYM36_000986 [Artemia franciscana]|uniref:Uncharacterized protein n=1 Tax=Artemia franciscana TaxID=6661 RepID=A0AA88IHZ5_ARTSF|nr:hypothetical protein QYM36_000986 [Artemia franciscana]